MGIPGIALQASVSVDSLVPTKPGFDLIKGFEGLALIAYPDPASPRAKTGSGSGDPWTIGWGHTEGVKEGDAITLAEAEAFLTADVGKAAAIIREQITVPLTQSQFNALVSLVFNLGYIPRSIKACLNGGTTDKGVVMEPGSYGSALKQLPRNCRAGGVPMKGLYRRRLAESCVWNDLPWENACSLNVLHFKLTPKGDEIDTDETTSQEDTIMRARQDIPLRPPIDISKPLPTIPPPAPKPAPEAAPAPADELVLDKVVEKPARTTPEASGAPAGEGAAPTTQPVTPPPPPKPAPPPPPPPTPVSIGQQTSAVDAAKRSEDWSANAKSMVYSRRFWGLALVMAGRVWMLKTGSNALLTAVSDPLVTEMFSGFAVMIVGELLQHWGEKKATRPLK